MLVNCQHITPYNGKCTVGMTCLKTADKWIRSFGNHKNSNC